MEGASRTVDRNEIIVHPESVTLCVAIREEPPLEHLVRRESYALYNVGRIESRLLDFCEEVFGVAVQLEDADIA